jgi:uncharacterized protein YjiK
MTLQGRVGPEGTTASRATFRWRTAAALLAALGGVLAAAWLSGGLLTALLLLSAQRSGGDGSGSVLTGLVADIEAKPIAGLPENLSGLTYSPVTDSLFAVINRPPLIAEISLDGRPLRQIPLHGAVDPEGISHVHGETFLIADEHDQSVRFLRIGPETASLRLTDRPTLRLAFDFQGNLGFEGASWDARTGRLYLVQEMRPVRVLMVDGLMAEPGGGMWSVSVKPWALPWLHRLAIRDLSSVSLHEESGHLLLLSDASAALLEYDTEGRLLGGLRLASGRHGLSAPVPQAEGLAVDPEGRVYVLSEPNLFYRFVRPAPAAR